MIMHFFLNSKTAISQINLNYRLHALFRWLFQQVQIRIYFEPVPRFRTDNWELIPVIDIRDPTDHIDPQRSSCRNRPVT